MVREVAGASSGRVGESVRSRLAAPRRYNTCRAEEMLASDILFRQGDAVMICTDVVRKTSDRVLGRSGLSRKSAS